ncbi:proline iminopeptidase [Salpingoeca rosetta]|uniref:Proline iminopeptidase n=1 Tax=Salpingoeca rosetta (strain ATCC 50818 / BSB-021) TaxID=946362 RepID=F2U7N2_SALR5|nr:proline iminopeptidase [Salpingoeca rosetta]EGD83449.1 proline iminopeptidase [Salpingoeca rosetta]|eukprot:XP_004994953.1 proline iminopeptidase [Salpingoeca rosetta]
MALYPPIQPFMSDYLQVSDIHTLYYEQCGNPDGYPVVFLHGGPGGGCRENDRRFFDPAFFRVILFDQRGAGRSKPHACLEDNTTWHLVADIEKLREHLGIDKWAVFGGSWGSTLALSYSQTHPDRVTALILRGIFTLRRKELLWFYQEGASHIMPDYWDEYLAPIPVEERGDLMSAYYKRLTGANTAEKLQCAKAWSTWECATAKLYVDPENVKRGSDPEWALAFARIECHYFVNGGFFHYDGQLISESHKIRHIPTTIVQGRYDLVCPMRTCWDLHKKFPEADVIIVDDNGHASSEPGIQRELVGACDRLRDDLTQTMQRLSLSPHLKLASRLQTAAESMLRPVSGSPYSTAPCTPSTAATHAHGRDVGGTYMPQQQQQQQQQQSSSSLSSTVRSEQTSAPGTPRRSSAEAESPRLNNVLHKRPLQPPGGYSHNIFG